MTAHVCSCLYPPPYSVIWPSNEDFFLHFLFYDNTTRSYLSIWFIITTPAIACNSWYLWSMNAFMINTKAAGSLSKLNRSIITFVSTQISLKCFGRFCVPFFLSFFLMENVSFKLYLFAFLLICVSTAFISASELLTVQLTQRTLCLSKS